MYPRKLEGKHIALLYTEEDAETRAEYLVVFKLWRGKLRPRWTPHHSYEPIDVPHDIDNRAISFLKRKSIDELVTVQRYKRFVGLELDERKALGSRECWCKYTGIATDEAVLFGLRNAGIGLRFYCKGKGFVSDSTGQPH